MRKKGQSADERPARRRSDRHPERNSSERSKPLGPSKTFKLEFHKNAQAAQKIAWAALEQHDVIFLLGPAGTGKTYLSMAYAIGQILSHHKQKIVLTRPIVEAGESLGFLPGTFDEKVNPYMMPLYDSISQLVGFQGPQFEKVQRAIETAPLAYMRGRTFHDSICIFDEAQNATRSQLKLFLTRLGDNSKMIITGDPTQSDLPGKVSLTEVVDRIQCLKGIGVVEFKACSIVRHPLVGGILEKLAD
jgi:phosphate starvation-inducible protein PhoH and related proteins